MYTILNNYNHQLSCFIYIKLDENFILTWTSKQKSPQGALLCIKANLR